MKQDHSHRMYDEALKYFPGGVNSPVRAFRSVHGQPVFMESGDGCHVRDIDGNRYIDFCCSWGPLILGHNHPSVRQGILDAVYRGVTFGTPTLAENRLARLIIHHHKYVEKIRFVNSGTEAVMSAIRLARGYTGRPKVLKFEGCYHGHVDSLMVNAGSGLVTFGTSSSAGIPEAFVGETLVAPLNDRAAVEKAVADYGSELACIIIEPIPANNGLLLQNPEFLQFLREICTANNILLIFDEVISGFRVGFEGAAGLFDIQPDLITYGKVMGGGMPVGAYGGRAEIMGEVAPDGPVYQAGTLSGNPVAMSAGASQLRECLRPGFYESLAERTSTFVTKVQGHADDKGYPFRIHAMGSIFWMAFGTKDDIRTSAAIDPNSMEQYKTLHRYMLSNGVYIAPSGYEVGFVSDAHTPHDLAEAATIMCAGLDAAFAE
ncbi:MAG: glutamate-1-semialdehyde 2,1-aminomutase [Salibacteraceae bacterium]